MAKGTVQKAYPYQAIAVSKLAEGLHSASRELHCSEYMLLSSVLFVEGGCKEQIKRCGIIPRVEVTLVKWF